MDVGHSIKTEIKLKKRLESIILELCTLISSSWITALSWLRGLCNSVNLCSMQCRATQDRQVIWKSSDKIWSTGGGNDNPLQYFSWRTPWTVWEVKNIWHQKMSPPGWKVSNMLLRKSGRQLLIAPVRIPGWAKAEMMLSCGCIWLWK